MHSIQTPIYQSEQIREFELLAEERFGVSGQVLMQRAGKGALDYLLRRWPQAKKLALFCGAGNNGGDGYTLAKLAQERGLKVTIWQVGNHSNLQAEAKQAFSECCDAKIEMNAFHEEVDIAHPDVIVDAICGIGLKNNLREEALLAIKKMQRSRAPIYALDIPSGVDADTGQVLGGAPYATATMTFIGLKLGLLTASGIAHTGELLVNDLQLPNELFASIEPIAEKMHLSTYQHTLKPRPRDWHKGLSGHVLVIGGNLGFSGAPRLAGEGALRVGAGLVTIATHPENAAFMNSTRPELMCQGVANAKELLPLMAKADVLVCGPGLGQDKWALTLWESIYKSELPLVLDADGLNLLAQAKNLQNRENWILTPHPGEAARLLDITPQEIQQDRYWAVKILRKRYGGIIVLKGAGTIVAAPNAMPALCDKGNSGMASAGMGDVLSGVIGGLIAQGIAQSEAAKLGVLLHAASGDLAAKEGERGMIALDLMPYLRRLANPSQPV